MIPAKWAMNEIAQCHLNEKTYSGTVEMVFSRDCFRKLIKSRRTWQLRRSQEQFCRCTLASLPSNYWMKFNYDKVQQRVYTLMNVLGGDRRIKECSWLQGALGIHVYTSSANKVSLNSWIDPSIAIRSVKRFHEDNEKGAPLFLLWSLDQIEEHV